MNEKVVPIRRPRPPKITYHCSLATDDPQSILRLAQLAADLGIKMFILEGTPSN